MEKALGPCSAETSCYILIGNISYIKFYRHISKRSYLCGPEWVIPEILIWIKLPFTLCLCCLCLGKPGFHLWHKGHALGHYKDQNRQQNSSVCGTVLTSEIILQFRRTLIVATDRGEGDRYGSRRAGTGWVWMEFTLCTTAMLLCRKLRRKNIVYLNLKVICSTAHKRRKS